MRFENLIGNLLKVLILIAVLGIILLSLTIFTYAVYEIVALIKYIIVYSIKMGKVVESALKTMDLLLIGVIFFIMGIGLFELFIRKINNLPEWLIIQDLDQLKTMLVKVIVIVIGVSFTGRIVTWDGSLDLMGYGIGVGAVILALSYFISVKIKYGKEDKKKHLS